MSARLQAAAMAIEKAVIFLTAEEKDTVCMSRASKGFWYTLNSELMVSPRGNVLSCVPGHRPEQIRMSLKLEVSPGVSVYRCKAFTNLRSHIFCWSR